MNNMEPVADLTNDTRNKLFAVNVNGPFIAIRSVIPSILKKSAGIKINNASLGGLYGGRADASYTATKHTLIGLTKSTDLCMERPAYDVMPLLLAGLKQTSVQA
jgi:NAD(P)-dependent dehydrogenase (short-subunit alcohol dehydrogenase family)